jgi:CBS domain-containing protein
MLTVDLISNNIPRLKLQDSISKAVQLVADFRVTHLPVVADDKFLGLLSEEDLLDAEDERQTVESLQEHFIAASVKDNVHFLNAVNVSTQCDSNIVPVINEEGDLTGVIATVELLKALGNFCRSQRNRGHHCAGNGAHSICHFRNQQDCGKQRLYHPASQLICRSNDRNAYCNPPCKQKGNSSVGSYF